jgi:hydroxypyruvate isomerase
VKEIDNPHLRMLFDIYHEYTQNGDALPLVTEAEPWVSVYHVADSPGRHDPGTGQMKWDEIYKAIGKTDYSGYLTFEYRPLGDEVASLKKAVTQMRRGVNSAKPGNAQS